MFGIADYGAFVVAIIVFLLIPGPGNLALITSTGKGSIKGGLAATLGVILGDQVLMWLAVAGVAALLSAYPAAFNAVQWLGAAYLAWLGSKMLLAKPGAAPTPQNNVVPFCDFFFLSGGFVLVGFRCGHRKVCNSCPAF